MNQVIGTVREFGEYLGDEMAVSVSMNEKGEPDSPLVLAELKNSANFRQFLEQQIAKYGGNQQGRPDLQFVDNPLTATAAAAEAGKKNESSTSGLITICSRRVRSSINCSRWLA